jgi:putative ABC transport system ATP-binding protein
MQGNAPAPVVDLERPIVVDVRDLRKVYASVGRAVTVARRSARAVDALAYAAAPMPGGVTALDEVTFSVRAGSFTAIMGASGSGKSTLLHLIGGLTPPTGGMVLVEGVNLGGLSDRKRTIFRRRRLGIIFQEYNLLPTLTARENVALPMLMDGKSARAWRERADELLAVVHLEQRADHRPEARSGGEQQRVAIARALLNDPAIVLADEPTGNLDSRQSLEIWQLMRRIALGQDKTILMVTHEAQGAAFADRVIILKDGRIVGTLEPKGSADAALVATGYQELAG